MKFLKPLLKLSFFKFCHVHYNNDNCDMQVVYNLRSYDFSMDAVRHHANSDTFDLIESIKQEESFGGFVHPNEIAILENCLNTTRVFEFYQD